MSKKVWKSQFESLPHGSGAIAPFQDGERILFLGDSITHNGDFIRWTQYLHHLRYPGTPLFLNAGVAGGSAGGGLTRLPWDVLSRKPERVFIMFGMNDLSIGLYKDGGNEMTPERLEPLENYRKNLEKLCDIFQEENCKTVLVTPTPYDQYDEGNPSTYNEAALSAGAKIVREIAEKRGLELVDFHAPLTELMKKRPVPTPMRGDHIHPNVLGQLLMAYYFWKEIKMDAVSGVCTVNAASGKAETPEFVQISEFQKNSKGISFRYSPGKLPFITDTKQHKGIDSLVPFTKEFNMELLQIKDLPSGKYTLLAGSRKIGSFDAETLAKGINLALMNTPAFYQAQKGFQILKTIRLCQSKLRNIAQIDCIVESRNGDIASDDSCIKTIDEWYNWRFKAGPVDHYSKYYKVVISTYKRNKRAKNEIKAQLEKATAKLRRECLMVSYMIELRKK